MTIPSQCLAANPTVLESVVVKGRLDGLVSQIEITQEYTNMEDVNVEAAYTFPLPLAATLLELKVDIGEQRSLQGVIRSRNKAQDRYEDAIAEGDSAILLEKIEAGLYTMSVGNILPGEKLRVSFTYAEVLRWQGDQVRFFLPTTIAPRYGDPGRAGLEGHQIPEGGLLVENRFRLHLDLHGLLQDAAIESPSHRVQVRRDADKAEVSLAGNEAFMDRDFILLLKAENSLRDFSLTARDDHGYTSLVCFQPRFDSQVGKGKQLSLVIDCSGSMAGDSIRLAKDALYKILTMLHEEDFFNIVAFGSNHKRLFERHQQATAGNLAKAKQFTIHLNADMGGTKMKQALMCAIAGKGLKDVFLVTDGEIWQGAELLDDIRSASHRFFVVGVGSAVSESLLASLAEETGGACEFVSPNEDMADKITRHASRMFQPTAKDISVTWPGQPEEKSIGMPLAVYQGDTVALFARYTEKPSGKFVFSCTLEDGTVWRQDVELHEDGDGAGGDREISMLSRLAGHASLRGNRDADEIEKLALRYQLMSEETAYLVIDEREADQKAINLPELRKVGHMLAAGWGGAASCYEAAPNLSHQGFYADAVHHASKSSFLMERWSERDEIMDNVAGIDDYLQQGVTWNWAKLLEQLEQFFAARGADKLCTLAELEGMGLSGRERLMLESLANKYSEDEVVFHLLQALLNRYGGEVSWQATAGIVASHQTQFSDGNAKKMVEKLVSRKISHPLAW